MYIDDQINIIINKNVSAKYLEIILKIEQCLKGIRNSAAYFLLKINRDVDFFYDFV